MTQREFTERTKVEVSASEYGSIETVYMHCDLDKDEFCKIWCKMNRSRVIAAKVKKAAEQREQEQKERLAGLYWTLFYNTKQAEKYSLMSREVLSESSIRFVESMDFRTEGVLVCNLMYKIATYLKIA